MKTLKAIAGLAIAPLLILLAEAGVTLLPCQRHMALRRDVYLAITAELAALRGR